MNILKRIIEHFKEKHNSGVSPEVMLENKKYPEVHLIMGDLNQCREFAEKRAKDFLPNKVKINEYFDNTGKNLKGYKVIGFSPTDLKGISTTVNIYKIIRKK